MNKTDKPIRCLVIQMTRLGDTLQSLMALRAAQQLYPKLELHFVAREKFAAAARRVPWIKDVIAFPTEEIIGPVIAGKKKNSEALRDLARWVSPLVQEPWDIVVNWSYSEASSYLAGLLPARVKLGYTRRKDRTFSAADGWSHYIQGIIQGGIEQNIHLTDILTTQLLTALQIHIGDPENEGNSPVTSKSFFSLSSEVSGWSWRDLSKKWVGFQLGAGAEAKSWSPEKWAHFAAQILRKHADHGIVLLGGKADLDRSRRFMAELRQMDSGGESLVKNVVSLVGETSFDLWANIVGRCQWVVAGDTAVVHLASVLGTRVLNLSIGPVRWAETGPYGNGHYIVRSSRPCPACVDTPGIKDKTAPHSCGADLRAEAVYGAWSFAASHWNHRKSTTIEAHFAQLGLSEAIPSVQVYKSRIRHTNDGGGVTYEPLISRKLEIPEWTSTVVGHIARAWYCGWVPPVGQGIPRERISPALVQRLRQVEESCDVMLKIFDEAGKTAATLKQRSSSLKSDKIMRLGDRDELVALGKRLQELDQLIERLAGAEPTLVTFSQMSKVLMHNMSGTRLSELGKESSSVYKQLNEGVSILRDWTKHTLKLARPVALSVASESPRDLTI
jgi:ADP-heptose:LPS heptosyltransferase